MRVGHLSVCLGWPLQRMLTTHCMILSLHEKLKIPEFYAKVSGQLAAILIISGSRCGGGEWHCSELLLAAHGRWWEPCLTRCACGR